MDRPLAGKVAVVTGASRGVGRGIALVLGEAGATVYVTGRSTRASPSDATVGGTLEDTVDAILARGGAAIALRCDHTREEDVTNAFEAIRSQHGAIDVLVSNAWGGYESLDGTGFGDGTRFDDPLWKQNVTARWDAMFERGVRAHLLTCAHALPLMLDRDALLVLTTGWDRDRYLGNVVYDLAKHAVARLAFALSVDAGMRGVTSVAVAPGLTLTERVRAVAPDAVGESPEYAGRAVRALACDPHRHAHAGRTFRVGDLAERYDFVDLDGRRVPPFEIPLPGPPRVAS